MVKTIFWEDLLYVCDYSADNYRLEFKVYPSVGLLDGGYELFAADSPGTEFTTDRDRARVMIEGSIKWDGCSDFIHPEEKTCMQHFCGLKNHEGYFQVWKRLYALAASEINKADEHQSKNQ